MPTTLAAEDDTALLHAKADRAEREGKRHLDALAAELRALGLPRGSYVIVNIDDGTYVTAPSRRAARVEFRNAHPVGIGWACRVEDLPIA